MKKIGKNTISIAIGSLVALILLELFLRIYNPFNNRMVAGEIKLPANVKYAIKNTQIPVLPSTIEHTKNELGFRGLPLDSAFNKKKLLCVGGSTTECFYLSDGLDWPAQLSNLLGNSVWVNNAGLDGHSTFGHIALLQNHLLQLKPNYILFLVGCNDVAAAQINDYEKEMLNNHKRLLEHSAIFTTYQSIKRAAKARNFGLHHQAIDFKNYKTADTTNWNKQSLSEPIAAYKKRILKLIDICKQHTIIPIFCSQPSALLHTYENNKFVGNRGFNNQSAMHYGFKLRSFNKATEECCKQQNVQFIDLANCMFPEPLMYYDYFHFTPTGAKTVANCIFAQLKI